MNTSNEKVLVSGSIIAIGALPPPYNGMSVVFENLCNSDICSKLNIKILDISDTRDIASIGKLDLVNVLLAFKHGFQFVKIMVRSRPSLVYLPIAQGTLGYLRDSLFLVPARIFHLPVVVHLHGGEFQNFFMGSSFLMRRLIRYTLERCRRAIVLGNGLKTEFDGLVPQENVSVVPNGIDVDCSGDGIERKGLRITFLGALKRRKGYQDLVYSIPSVLKVVPDAQFTFAGEVCDNDTYYAVIEYIRENRLENHVEFTGAIQGESKYELLKNSDVFCFPPIEPEGQPLVILEAMACGLPVVTTKQGAIPDLVDNSVTGFVVEPGDVNQLAKKIAELAHSSEMRIQMGRLAREKYLKCFTRDKWAQSLFEIFCEEMD